MNETYINIHLIIVSIIMIDIEFIKRMPKESRTADQKMMLLKYQRNLMLDRRRGRRRRVFMSLGVKESNYANSTMALYGLRCFISARYHPSIVESQWIYFYALSIIKIDVKENCIQ